MKRPTIILVVLGAILIALGASGLLQANRDAEITKVEAVEIAVSEVDFEPDTTIVRFLRSGAQLQPTWIVSLGTEPSGDDPGRLSVVQVHATNGETIKVAHER